jgi:uncharacterized protein (DUF697 family)
MTEATKKVKKIRRTRKRVYETVEAANVPKMSSEAAEILVEEPALSPLDSDVQAVEQPAEVIVDPDAEKRRKALAVIRNYTLLSGGVGAVPVPILDLATMLALQMLLVRKLASLYNIPYAGQRAKSAVAGLLCGFEGGFFGFYALKMIPILGYAVMPAVNAAVCYALGKVFIQHFESGGTFLDFDPKKVRAYFEDQYREGKLKAL